MPTNFPGSGVSLSVDESPVLRASNVSKNHATGGAQGAMGGKIYKIYVYNSSAAIVYFQIFKNLTPSATAPFDNVVPADGAVPSMSYEIAVSSSFSIDFPNGDPCPTSIVWALSSTSATKTITAAIGLVHVEFH